MVPARPQPARRSVHSHRAPVLSSPPELLRSRSVIISVLSNPGASVFPLSGSCVTSTSTYMAQGSFLRRYSPSAPLSQSTALQAPGAQHRLPPVGAHTCVPSAVTRDAGAAHAPFPGRRRGLSGVKGLPGDMTQCYTTRSLRASVRTWVRLQACAEWPGCPAALLSVLLPVLLAPQALLHELLSLALGFCP